MRELTEGTSRETGPGRKRWFRRVLFWLVVLYLSGPVIAALLDAHDRRGPLIYPAGYHGTVYSLVYQVSHGEKARVPLFRKRPWFYGMKAPLVDVPPGNSILRERYEKEKQAEERR